MKLHLIIPLSCVLFASTGIVQAQATRTWVSGVGDDANPCSRTAPCKTFGGTISKTAANGEINVLDPGGFGAVTITKAITIDGGGFLSGVLVSGTHGIIVNAGVNDVVTLRNLDINGLTTGLSGIRYIAGKLLTVENAQIYGFTRGIDVDRTTAGNLNVIDTVIRTCSSDGIRVTTTRANPSSGAESRYRPRSRPE